MSKGPGWWGQRGRHRQAALEGRVRDSAIKEEARRPRRPRKEPKVLHFKTQEDYDKWAAHVAIHRLERPHPRGDYPRIVIAGKPHKVQHER